MIIMSHFVLCVFLANLCSGIATFVNNSDKITSNERDQCGCSHDIQQLYTEIRENRRRIEALETYQSDVKLAADVAVSMEAIDVFPDVIGFTSRMANVVANIPVGSIVIFDEVIYNAGDHYNPVTGVFTCPRSGMYLFSVVIESHSASTITTATVTITINGKNKVYAISEPTELGHDTSGGNVLIQHIQQGDRVWVETYGTNNQVLHEGFNTFAGVLIHSTETAPS